MATGTFIIILEVAPNFVKSRRPCRVSYFITSTVSADRLAPSGVQASADKEMTTFVPPIGVYITGYCKLHIQVVSYYPKFLAANFSWFLCVARILWTNRSHPWLLMPWLLSSSEYKQPRCFNRTILRHWRRDKIAAIFNTTFINGFSWMKMYKFRIRFHWSLFLWAKLV